MDGTVRIDDEKVTELTAAVDRGIEVDSVALARLMEEVRNADDLQPTSYNRMHNRHNRS